MADKTAVGSGDLLGQGNPQSWCDKYINENCKYAATANDGKCPVDAAKQKADDRQR